MTAPSFPIIDSHIHLYARTQLQSLNWTSSLPVEHILNRQNSVDEYRACTGNNPNLLGFVFVETDRKSGLSEDEWDGSLEEVKFLARIARDQPFEGQGHGPEDGKLVLGIVPWAPLPTGVAGLKQYVAKVKGACDGDNNVLTLVKGFRYLLQDKPAGTGKRARFIEGLRWLGEQDYLFELGVDMRQGGIDQLREAREMLDQVFMPGGLKLKVVINHCCKPNLHLMPQEVWAHQDFIMWAECIRAFASHPSIYIKLSGFFSELPPQSHGSPSPIKGLANTIKPWVKVVFEAFGPTRVMFGSDWPVCMANGPGLKSWQHWTELVAAVLEEQGLNMQEKKRVWAGTAAEVYSIDVPISHQGT